MRWNLIKIKSFGIFRWLKRIDRFQMDDVIAFFAFVFISWIKCG